ncbi:IS911 ORF1 [Shigella flexneri]|uniref:IS911 ORF1 n=1 Tax=Shigella flexneri TaxID=623 RepID=A0A658Z6L7_SHIFL|nr:hypothetical protein [Shigella flexneri]SVH92218.1 IS911 ORF1 [Shigella flexneri]
MKKRNFSAEFKRESAQLVVDQKYTSHFRVDLSFTKRIGKSILEKL